MVASGMEGTSRQLALLQAAIKILGVAILLPFFIAERAFDFPFLFHAVLAATSSPTTQVALVYLACQIAAVVAHVLFDKLLQPLLERLAPPSPDETASKPRYLYDQALSEPETALALVDREQARVFSFLPLHLGRERSLGKWRNSTAKWRRARGRDGLGRCHRPFSE